MVKRVEFSGNVRLTVPVVKHFVPSRFSHLVFYLRPVKSPPVELSGIASHETGD